MLITSHAAGAVMVARQEPSGSVYCATMRYETDRSLSCRHMMETGESRETVLETLRNGILKELAAKETDFDYSLVQPEPVLMRFGRDERHPGGVHMKVFFVVKHLSGAFRTRSLPDGTATMGPVEIEEIEAYIQTNEGKTPSIHTDASKAALVGALAADKAVFNRYESIILSYEQHEPTQEERDAIALYPGKW